MIISFRVPSNSSFTKQPVIQYVQIVSLSLSEAEINKKNIYLRKDSPPAGQF